MISSSLSNTKTTSAVTVMITLHVIKSTLYKYLLNNIKKAFVWEQNNDDGIDSNIKIYALYCIL